MSRPKKDDGLRIIVNSGKVAIYYVRVPKRKPVQRKTVRK